MNEEQHVLRLDAALVVRGFFTGRDRAKDAIAQGRVCINGKVCKKAAQPVQEADVILLLAGDMPDFVSRGGSKLERAMAEFELSVQDLVCIDIGAAAGGFTDCMLRRGAQRVFAIDSGSDQLVESLRRDVRVISMENTNIRDVLPEQLGGEADFAAVDVSFISLRLVLPVLYRLIRSGSRAVCLVKPQFEAGKQAIGKKGVVKDRKIHEQVLRTVAQYCAENRMGVQAATYSPTPGPEGNIEFLFLLQKDANCVMLPWRAVVAQAHEQLNGR